MYRYEGSHPTMVAAYVYDADVHCRVDTIRYLKATNQGDIKTAVDREGNRIGPVFAGEEVESRQHCADCKRELTD